MYWRGITKSGSRTPRGVRELKLQGLDDFFEGAEGRTPRGVRELKPIYTGDGRHAGYVAPHAGCVN